MITLPDEYVDKYVSFFEKHGMEVERSVVEEMLWQMASEGVEEPDYPRYYALGNHKEKSTFEQIESISEGELWETQMEINGIYYRVACNLT